MAQFIAFDKDVKVTGEAILSVVNILSSNKDKRIQILNKYNINPEINKWYSQQDWLNAFKEMYETIGTTTLFLIGKLIPKTALWSNGFNDLQGALKSIDISYHLNHKGGNIGHYELTRFDEKHRKAIMICKNPYPSDFDRGIITYMLRKYKPLDTIDYGVYLDKSKETRLMGGESCTFNIYW